MDEFWGREATPIHSSTHPLPLIAPESDIDKMNSPALNIVLVHPEIPHNTGAIGRLCVGLGCRLHLIRPLGFSLTSKMVRRAGMDYWQHVELCEHDNWSAFIESERPRALAVASTHGQASLYATHFTPGHYLVFGSESGGLPKPLDTELADRLFRIPMPGEHARSLNLAQSVAIVAYEAYRQLSPV